MVAVTKPRARAPEARPTAVIYLRVSTKEQAQRGGEAEGFSIPAQREACRRKAEAFGAQVIEEFIDAGESARSAHRPELQRMLGFIKEQRVSFAIVHKVDRLARNRVDDVEINVALTAAGVQLVSCSENIDETPSGMLLHGIMSSIAEFYSRNLATESRKGMLQKAKGGGTPGMAPFGYVNVRERTPEGREVRTVSLDPDRAHWVRWLFERYATAEWTAAMLRDELERLGVTTLPRPNTPSRPLATSQVHNMLKNRYYVGFVSFEGVEYRGNHPKLIDEELYQRVQDVRQARHQSGEKPRVRTHYLKGSIHCGQCGEPLSLEVSRNRLGKYYHYFYCLGRQSLKNGCTFRAAPVDLIEELVEQHWRTVTLPDEHCQQIRQLVWEHIEHVLPRRLEQRDRAKQQLAQLDAESDKLMQAHYQDAVPLELLKSEQQRIALTRGRVERDLSQAELDAKHIEAQLNRCVSLLARAEHHYRAGDSVVRRDLNQGVFEKIYIDDDSIVGADLTAAFQRLMSDDLAGDLRAERTREQTRPVRTSDLYVVRDVPAETAGGGLDMPRDLPRRDRRRRQTVQMRDFLARERPRGVLPWERKNPGPSQVRGSNETLLVAGAGFEPATSGL